MDKTKRIKFWVDLGLFIGFLAAFFYDQTGLNLHQWIGVAVGAVAGYHLLTHWGWVKNVTSRFFGKTSPKARLYYVFDALILVGLLLILSTGLVISSWFSLSLMNYRGWVTVHILTSILTLLAVVLKIGVHWRWVVTTLWTDRKRPVPAGKPNSPALQPVLAENGTKSAQVNRRDFLRMMGVVGAASVLAVGISASALKDVLASEPAESTGTSAIAATNATSALPSPSATADQTCQVRCPRGCSYPGRCRRYTDANGNNRCDLGECI